MIKNNNNNNMNKSSGYDCKFCVRNFKEKFNYDRHILCCEFFHKSVRERNNEVEIIESLPTQIQMYQLIQELAIRVNRLEKENRKLLQSQKRKINILDWLNENNKQPSIIFSTWISGIVYQNIVKHLDVVFQNDLTSGIIRLFDKIFNDTDTDSEKIPICSFDNKPNVFYIYDFRNQKMTDSESGENTPVWATLSISDFNMILKRISHRFLIEFKKNWYDKHKYMIDNDETYKDKYIIYYKNILGGDQSDETRSQKIRNWLYSRLKTNIQSIIEYSVS